MTFDHLGLRPELMKAIRDKGYTKPTPIQNLAIPAILHGRDLLARAQTGTGKTDAFALPMVELLSQQPNRLKHPRALVLTPTRELALQVGECIQAYARRTSLRCTVVYGGVSLPPQIEKLKKGIDILVATPGRLLDLAGNRHLRLSHIEFFVLDEADRMLDMGFSKAITEIRKLLPSERKTMLFSATYSSEIKKLAATMLQDPAHIEIEPEKTAAESVSQRVHMVARENKRALLLHLLSQEASTQVLVFSRTKHGANKLAEKLANHGIRTAALHGNKSQSVRTRTLSAFKNNDIRVLVATDVAARGLDIDHLPFVVNFDIPGIAEDYVHRIGRTGRAGASGIAISFVSSEEKASLKAIEQLLGQKIPVKKVDGFTEDDDLPAHILLRPGNKSSEKRADREILELVQQREARKQASREKTKSRRKNESKASRRPAFSR
ncbi:DEAD/DEAH box helicase [Desulfobotulus sp. H1]|uniref:DEAD/DEAH box helicase n=1 Tax=Desulfobotulus pelophilus TaxID=2823377 RepID=A0ABT3NC05_9BACT|nr:DEAD/DEAH box helicase [Desulfobotulus pelophilus]MCW7754989.1 DEAD/DEAH box helicase [Desulfobotulus pelophilus]